MALVSIEWTTCSGAFAIITMVCCVYRDSTAQQPWQVEAEQSEEQHVSRWMQVKQWVGRGWQRFCMVINLPTASALAGTLSMCMS